MSEGEVFTESGFFEVYPDADGAFRWRKVGGNGEITSHGQAYTRRWSASAAARRDDPRLQVRQLMKDTRA